MNKGGQNGSLLGHFLEDFSEKRGSEVRVDKMVAYLDTFWKIFREKEAHE